MIWNTTGAKRSTTSNRPVPSRKRPKLFRRHRIKSLQLYTRWTRRWNRVWARCEVIPRIFFRPTWNSSRCVQIRRISRRSKTRSGQRSMQWNRKWRRQNLLWIFRSVNRTSISQDRWARALRTMSISISLIKTRNERVNVEGRQYQSEKRLVIIIIIILLVVLNGVESFFFFSLLCRYSRRHRCCYVHHLSFSVL